jgi:preprotein translocase subunit YajC
MKKCIAQLICFSSLLLASPLRADDVSPRGGGPNMLIMVGMALVFFYFILWRPEQKRRKLVEKQRSSMKIGDRVTAMGIVGVLDSIQENTVILKMRDGSKIEMLKNCVTDVQAPESKTEGAAS